MDSAVPTIADSHDPLYSNWARLGVVARATGKSVRTLNYQLRSLPYHAKRKVGGAWEVDLRFRPDWKLAIASEGNKLRIKTVDPARWTAKSIKRDALIRRFVGDADEFAGAFAASKLKLTMADEVFCRQRGGGYYDLRFTPRTLRGWRRAIQRGESFPERRGRKSTNSAGNIGSESAALYLGMYTRPAMTQRRAWQITMAATQQHPGDPAGAGPAKPQLTVGGSATILNSTWITIARALTIGGPSMNPSWFAIPISYWQSHLGA